MAAVEMYGPSLTEKEQQGGAVGIQEFHGAPKPNTLPAATNPTPSGAVGRVGTVNDIVDRLMQSAGNTYRQAQPAAVGDPTASTGGWKEAVDYAMSRLSIPASMNLGRGGRRGANAAAELNALLAPTVQAYGAEVGAKGQFAGQQVAGNAAVSKGRMEFGEKQLGTAAVLNDSNVNAQYYNDLTRNKGIELTEDKRWHDLQYRMGMDRNNALRDNGGGGGGAVSKAQKADRKAIDKALSTWDKGKAATAKQEAIDTKAGGEATPGYRSVRENQNQSRRAYERAMKEYTQKYGEVYTGGGDVKTPGAVAAPVQPQPAVRQSVTAQPAPRSKAYTDLRKEFIME